MLARTLLLFVCTLALAAQNKPERLQWFRDLGFGMFIHWSVDVSLGSVISHSLVGASPEYVARYYDTLPRYFNPRKFEPEKWAMLAKLAGMKYVVFTAKHHSGFAMFATETTKMNAVNTPFGRDPLKEIVAAYRKEGIAIGLYISPDDFYWMHTNGLPIARPPAPKTTTKELPAMLDYGKRQLKELLTNYGKIDILFIDGPADGLREYAWELNPEIVVTRGAMETPEQSIPEIILDQPWEACLTIGTAWQHKYTNEAYKTGTDWIRTLVEVRAKGGNLLLNVGPTADGEIFRDEEARLREFALWNFVNGEAVTDVRPWVVDREGDVWFTSNPRTKTVYAFVGGKPFAMGERRQLALRSVKLTAQSKVDVLGQSGERLEYRPTVDAATKVREENGVLHIDMMHAQRMYDNRRWPNPVVVRITNAQPGFTAPVLSTLGAKWDEGRRCHVLEGELKSLGSNAAIDVSFHYRKRRGLADLYEAIDPWKNVQYEKKTAAGRFSHCLMTVPKEGDYEFRAIARHPLGVVFANEVALRPESVVKLH